MFATNEISKKKIDKGLKNRLIVVKTYKVEIINTKGIMNKKRDRDIKRRGDIVSE